MRDKKTSLIPSERIERCILFIRDQKVMLDMDLAELYGVGTKVLLQAVKRNINRFPMDFMFQLNKEEFDLFEVTICDLKHIGRARRAAIRSLCLYGTRGGHAFQCLTQSPGD